MKDLILNLLVGLGFLVLIEELTPYAKKLAVRVRCWWLLRNLK